MTSPNQSHDKYRDRMEAASDERKRAVSAAVGPPAVLRVAAEIWCHRCQATLGTASVLTVAGAPFTFTMGPEFTGHLTDGDPAHSEVSVYFKAAPAGGAR